MPVVFPSSFRLQRDDKKKLSDYARQLHVSKAEVIRLLLRGKIHNPIEQLLSPEEKEALVNLAAREKREPLQQAVILIRTMLEIEGLLEIKEIDDHAK